MELFSFDYKRKKVKERVPSYKERKEGGREREMEIVATESLHYKLLKSQHNAVMRLTMRKVGSGSDRARRRERH